MNDSEQIALVQADIRLLVEYIGRPPSKLRQNHPDHQVCHAIRAMLGSPESIESGEIVCRIRRLPDPWKNTLFECLTGSPPYTSSETRPDGEVVIRNDGADLEYVARLGRQVPYNPVSGESEPARTTFYDVKGKWPAGETKTIALGVAIRLLQDYSLQAVPPLARQNANVRTELLPLREIGYRIRMAAPETGEVTTYESKSMGKAKSKAA